MLGNFLEGEVGRCIKSHEPDLSPTDNNDNNSRRVLVLPPLPCGVVRQMVWDEYRSIQGQRGAIAFSKEAAAAAWQGLPLSGLAHYTDANVESRGRDLSYAGGHACVFGTGKEPAVAQLCARHYVKGEASAGGMC